MITRLSALLATLNFCQAGALGCQRSEATVDGGLPARSASASANNSGAETWEYGQPCVPTRVRSAELVWSAETTDGVSLAVLDDQIFVATSYGILREDGDLLIPLDEAPFDFTASDGYLYWTMREGRSFGIYTSLSVVAAPRRIGEFIAGIPIELNAAMRGVVIINLPTNELYYYSQMGPSRMLEGCASRGSEWVGGVAESSRGAFWTGGSGGCARIDGGEPHSVDFPGRATAVGMDNENFYWTTGCCDDAGPTPSLMWRRAISGGEAVLVAKASETWGALEVRMDSLYWETLTGRIERAPKSGRDNRGRETLVCGSGAWAVTDDYLYWSPRVPAIAGIAEVWRMNVRDSSENSTF